MEEYNVIGLMSGTSLDGLDVAYCRLTYKKKVWRFKLIEAKTYPYSSEWKAKLGGAHLLTGEALMALHSGYGEYVGETCRRFIQSKSLKKVDLIASHGHTIFHQPKQKFTFQLGDGNFVHAKTGLPVAFDFRSLDVISGGQGAPLVPVGDRYLFGEYDVCLNLGGIANLSMEVDGERIAFDICFVNMALNYLTNKVDREYDKGGALASGGAVNKGLLHALTSLYKLLRKKRPSLGREGFEEWIKPLLDDESISIEDRLCTIVESVAEAIDDAIPKKKKLQEVLATGGGAHNSFLISRLRERLKDKAEVIVPEKPIVEFKEALVFALLGVLRLRNDVNVLKSVTGAKRDTCSGVLIG